MSRTYGSKYDFNKNYNTKDVYKSPSEIYESADKNAAIKTRRHPNKKKKTLSLGREFAQTNLPNPTDWKWKYAEEDEQSHRTHLARKEVAQKRRSRLKHDTEDMINQALEEYYG